MFFSIKDVTVSVEDIRSSIQKTKLPTKLPDKVNPDQEWLTTNEMRKDLAMNKQKKQPVVEIQKLSPNRYYGVFGMSSILKNRHV